MARKIDDKTLLSMLKKGKMQKEIAAHFGVTPPAIVKRMRLLFPERYQVPESFERLPEKRKRFVLEKAEGRTATDAAMVAFDCKNRESAKVLGSNMMKDPDVQESIRALMDQAGLSRRYRVGKLRQHVDHLDPNVSLKALDQTWKLEGAYLEKPEVNIEINLEAEFQAIRELELVREKLIAVIEQGEGS